MAILKIRDADGNVQEVLCLRGEKGDKGDPGEFTGGELLKSHIADKDNPHEVTAEQVGAVTQEEMEAFLSENYVTQWDFDDATIGIFGGWYYNNGNYYRTSIDYAEELLTKTAAITPEGVSADLVYIPVFNYIHTDNLYYSVTVEGSDGPYVAGVEIEKSDSDGTLSGLNVYVGAADSTTVKVKVHILGRLAA